MTHHRRSPRSLTFALDALQDNVIPASPLGEIQRVWPEAVGRAIAVEAVPTAERGGVLTVSCSAAVWAQELDLMGTSIVTRLNTLLERTQVARLRCVTR